MRFLWVSFVLMSLLCGARAQGLFLNQTPPHYLWKHLRTDKVQLIVSDTFSTIYTRWLADRFHTIYPYVCAPYETPRRPMSVILRNYNTVSNGFVSLFPRRMECFAVAPTNHRRLGGNALWFDLLTIHELRHVAQFAHVKAQHRWLYTLFGEVGVGLSAATKPLWLWEGDAVMTETRLTRGGRGQLPEFKTLFFANRMRRKPYSYDRQRLGSWQSPVANEYVLGYFMVGYLEKHYGKALLPKLWRLNYKRALKQHTGLSPAKVYRRMCNEIEHLWRLKNHPLDTTTYRCLPRQREENFTDFSYPVVLADGSIWSQKKGVNDIYTWVCLNRERPKYEPGLVVANDYFSGRQRWLVWNERRYDARFLDINHSVIKLLNTQTMKTRTLNKGVRAMGASLSPDGTKIATVVYDPKGTYQLELWNASTGDVIQRWYCGLQEQLLAPRFNEEGTAVLAVKILPHSQYIMRYALNQSEQAEEVLWVTQTENIAQLAMRGDTLLYTSNYSGVDEIHMLDLRTHQRYALTESVFGACHARFIPNSRDILYQVFTPLGYRVVQIPLTRDRLRPIGAYQRRSLNYYHSQGHAASAPAKIPVTPLIKTPSAKPTMARYHRTKRMLKPHSWGALPPMILANDPLSNLTWGSAIQPNLNYNDASIALFATYSALYPIFSIRLESNPLIYPVHKANIPHRFQVNMRIPLLLTRSVFNQTLNFQTGFIHDIKNAYMRREDLWDRLYYGIHYRYTKRVAPRTILPKRGFETTLLFQHQWPFSQRSPLQRLLWRQNTYLLAPHRHHVLWMRHTMEWRLRGRPTYTMPIARNFTNARNAQFGLNFNYTFPVVYPDISIGPLIYMKRLSLNLFYDLGLQYNRCPQQCEPRYQSLYSTGIELWNTSHFLRTPFAIRSGIAAFYNAYTNQFQYQILFQLPRFF